MKLIKTLITLSLVAVLAICQRASKHSSNKFYLLWRSLSLIYIKDKVLGMSKFDTGHSKMTENTTNLHKCCVKDMSK